MSNRVAVFPLSYTYLPGDGVSLRIFEDRYVRMLEDISSSGLHLSSVLIERGAEVGGDDLRMSHGISIDIIDISFQDSWLLHGRANQVLTIDRWVADNPYPTALVSPQTSFALDEEKRENTFDTLRRLEDLYNSSVLPVLGSDGELERLEIATSGTVHESEGGMVAPPEDETLWRLFWGLARRVPCGPLDRYDLLKPGGLPERLVRLESILNHVDEVIRFRTQD